MESLEITDFNTGGADVCSNKLPHRFRQLKGDLGQHAGQLRALIEAVGTFYILNAQQRAISARLGQKYAIFIDAFFYFPGASRRKQDQF